MIKPLQRQKHLQENLLSDILNVFLPAEYPAHQREHTLLVAPDKLLKGRFRPALCQLHKLFVLVASPPLFDRHGNRGSTGCHTLWDVSHTY